MSLPELVFILFKEHVKLICVYIFFFFSNNALFSTQLTLGLVRQVTWEPQGISVRTSLGHLVPAFVTFSELRESAPVPQHGGLKAALDRVTAFPRLSLLCVAGVRWKPRAEIGRPETRQPSGDLG